jgi:hypothetical protein
MSGARRSTAILLRVMFLVGMVGLLVLAQAGSALVGWAVPGPPGELLGGLAAAGIAIAVYLLLVRRVERRPVTELGALDAPGGLGRGAALGLLAFAVTIGVIAAFGGYRVTGLGSAGGGVSALGLAIGAAAAEEVVFRGVVFRVLEELTGSWVALAASAALFGAAHLANPEATLWGAVAIAVEAGLMLGICYVATRSLWLPIGLHLGWNFAEAGIFGAPMSGSGSGGDGLLASTFSGPVALTGGAFGPEASVVAVLVCLAVAGGFLRAAVRQGRILSFAGRRPGRMAG